MDFKNLVKSLEAGICPAELCYNSKADQEIDWHRVRYNTFYRSTEFFESKFPQEFENIPGFDKVIDMIVEKNKDNTPLKEISQKTMGVHPHPLGSET
jgi:hypothetical protein